MSIILIWPNCLWFIFIGLIRKNNNFVILLVGFELMTSFLYPLPREEEVSFDLSDNSLGYASSPWVFLIEENPM